MGVRDQIDVIGFLDFEQCKIGGANMKVQPGVYDASEAGLKQVLTRPLSTSQGFEALYHELRRLAKYRLSRGESDRLLQTTGLVHEVYIRLSKKSTVGFWANRAHFYAAASEAMRNVLIDQIRASKRLKRGGTFHTGPLSPVMDLPDEGVESERMWVKLDQALDELESEDPMVAQLVKLVVFGGLSVAEAGGLLELSRSTAYEYWGFARSWLQVWDSDGDIGS